MDCMAFRRGYSALVFEARWRSSDLSQARHPISCGGVTLAMSAYRVKRTSELRASKSESTPKADTDCSWHLLSQHL